MTELLLHGYLWLKAAHVVSVILWMGAQLALGFMLAAQASLPREPHLDAQLAAIERRLVHRLLNPAILAAFLFGGLMVYALAATTESLPAWLLTKLALALLLSAVHGLLVRAGKRAALGKPVWQQRTWNLLFWLQLAMVAGIAALVILRPLS
jgi:protoporphyrinogen IX oxidase